jgi:lysyl-tRNA synthetase class I
MEVILSREKALNTFQNLQGILTKEWVYGFNYAVIRNKQNLESITKKIRKELQDFEEKKNDLTDKRIEICKKYARKDANGKAVLINNNYDILDENKQNFDDELKPIMEEVEQLGKERQDYLEEEIKFEGYGIQKKYIPDKMVGSQQEAVMLFEIDNIEEKELSIN